MSLEFLRSLSCSQLHRIRMYHVAWWEHINTFPRFHARPPGCTCPVTESNPLNPPQPKPFYGKGRVA